MPDQ
jgi:hypothetical protein